MNVTTVTGSSKIVKAILTVDVVLLTLLEAELQVALFKREAEPFLGRWALPGGYIHEDEDDSAKAAAARVLLNKTGVASPYLEEFGTFSGPARDPRGWSLTVVYYALVPAAVLRPSVKLFPLHKLPGLPFDHTAIVAGVLQRVRSKASYSSLPVHLCPPEFTIPELHAVYEAVLGVTLNTANFRRKLDDLELLEEIPGATRISGRNRPGQLYRVAKRYQDSLSVRERGL
jgi:8-oxo-dGTP diphosphatase